MLERDERIRKRDIRIGSERIKQVKKNCVSNSLLAKNGHYELIFTPKIVYLTSINKIR